MNAPTQHHTIISLVEDKPGVLARVASLFRRRGFNIASLAVGHSEQMGLSRMTFVVEGDEYTVDQATKQLDKLIDIVKVADITGADMVARELALIKIATTLETRSQIIEIVQLFRAKIVDVGSQSVVVETTGEEAKIDALIELLEPFGITELMRTGRVAMVRGKATGEISDNFSTNYFGANQDRATAREVGSY